MKASNDVFKAIVADTSPFIIKGGWFPSRCDIKHQPSNQPTKKKKCAQVLEHGYLNHSCIMDIASCNNKADNGDLALFINNDQSAHFLTGDNS